MTIRKVAIDRGHGGIDPGAVGFVREIDVVYPWGNALFAHLLLAGFEPFFTHEDPRPREKVSIGARVRQANRVGADLFISVHANGVEDPRATGSEVWIYRRDSAFAFEIAEKVAPVLAMTFPDRGVKTNTSFGVLRRTKMPAVLLETGFVTNEGDARFLIERYLEQVTGVVDVLRGYK